MEGVSVFRTLALGATLLLVPVLAAAESAANSVAVADAYVRAVPPGQPNSVAFMMLRNGSGEAHAVVSASSPAAQTVELHTHVNENGMMMMRPVERIEVPANGETALQPGGYHVMLIGLNEPLVPGTPVSLTLTFEDGSQENVTAPVRKLQMKMKPMPGMAH